MMDGCKAALPLVEKLADSEASPIETREAEAHLALCPDCRAHLEALRAFATFTREGRPPDPPDSYWEHLPRRVLERIESERLRPQALWRRLLAPGMLRLQALWISCVLLVAVGVIVLKSELRDTRAPASAPPSPETPVASVPPVADVPAVPGATGAEAENPTPGREKPTPDQRADLNALGYLREPPPIARDEPAPPEADAASGATMRANAPSPPEALASTAPEPAPQAAGARETAVEVSSARLDAERASSEEASFRLLKQKEEEPESRRRSVGAAHRALTVDSGESSDPCADWRRFLETYGDAGARGGDARYELARCSLRRYEQAPADSSREIAIADADRFLEREPEGPRAEEIRKALEAVRR
jgi:hypothetical protein